jgi:UDP-N-acetylglucosamine--N-acetylmuramyl-(pentapeptide) pyrophosphoryl-undecaprenol N-acetylglucosamine transferase
VRGRRGIVIAGGGTAGHVVPSMQIALALDEQGHAIEFYGSRRGQEASIWSGLAFPFTLLPGRGIRRSVRPEALWANAGAVLGLLWATVASLASFATRRPRAVVVVGGYAGFPAGFAAVVTRVPLILVTTDAVPGAVNALLGRFAAASAVAFAGTDLPRAQVTGTPVRPELGALDRSPASRREARTALGLPADRSTVAAVGGSLGARRINTAVAGLAERWATREDLSLYHVAGRRDYAQFARTGDAADDADHAEADGGLAYEVVPFEDRMPVFYAAADLYVCRAGAMTVAELLVCGVPAILVPLPGAPRDHQTRNAEVLVAAGAAILVPDAECTAARLESEVDALLADADRLAAMGESARRMGHPDAAARVAALVDAHAR